MRKIRSLIAPLLVAALVLSVAAPAIAKPAGKTAGKTVTKRVAKTLVNTARRKVTVSHPYLAKNKVRLERDFNTWGYIKPVALKSTESTITIVVAKWEGKRSWVASSGLEAKGSFKNAKRFKNKTRYNAELKIPATGRYRMRAVLEWVDAKGVVRVKGSSWKYFRVVK